MSSTHSSSSSPLPQSSSLRDENHGNSTASELPRLPLYDRPSCRPSSCPELGTLKDMPLPANYSRILSPKKLIRSRYEGERRLAVAVAFEVTKVAEWRLLDRLHDMAEGIVAHTSDEDLLEVQYGNGFFPRGPVNVCSLFTLSIIW